MINFTPCEKCKGKNGNLAQPGYIRTLIPCADGSDKTVEVLEECDCHKKWREDCRVESTAKRANLNTFYMNYNPSVDYIGSSSKQNLDRLLKFKDLSFDSTLAEDKKNKLKSSVIYIYGPNGTQKTSIGNYLGFEFIRHHKTVYYCLMNNLIKKLEKAERNDDIVGELDRIADVDLLIIDESFDKEKITLYKSNYQIPFLDTFLRSRLQEHHKGIIFISNVPMESIENNGFSHSIQDFVCRNVKNYEIELKDNYMQNKSDCDEEALF